MAVRGPNFVKVVRQINISRNPSEIIKNPLKLSQKVIAKKISIYPSLRNVLSSWTTSSSKQRMRQQLQWPAIFYPCLGKKCIPSLSIGSYLHQNPQTNSISQKEFVYFLQISHVNLFQYNTKAAIIQNETNIPSLHCLCIMREKLLQRSWLLKRRFTLDALLLK